MHAYVHRSGSTVAQVRAQLDPRADSFPRAMTIGIGRRDPESELDERRVTHRIRYVSKPRIDALRGLTATAIGEIADDLPILGAQLQQGQDESSSTRTM